MGWATVVPIIQVRTDREASPAPVSLILLCLRAVRSARKAAGAVSCPTQGEHRTWPLYPHPQAENLSPFRRRKRESALLTTGGSREIALGDSTINGWDVIYEKRLAKADPSS